MLDILVSQKFRHSGSMLFMILLCLFRVYIVCYYKKGRAMARVPVLLLLHISCKAK